MGSKPEDIESNDFESNLLEENKEPQSEDVNLNEELEEAAGFLYTVCRLFNARCHASEGRS